MTDSLPPAEWRFSDPKNLAVITTKAILKGTRPILGVGMPTLTLFYLILPETKVTAAAFVLFYVIDGL